MNKTMDLATKIDGYRVELSCDDAMECIVTGELLKRELKATLKVLRISGKIEHVPSGECHEVQAETIVRITAWAAQNGYAI